MKFPYKIVLTSILFSILLGAVSCGIDESRSISGEKPDDADGEGYLTFGLSTLSNTTTKGIDDAIGTKGENAVKEVYMVLYSVVANAPDTVVEQIRLDAYNNDGTTPFTGNDVSALSGNYATSIRFVAKAQEVKLQDYKMLILANPTTAIKEATKVGKNFTAFNTAVNATIDDFGTINTTEYGNEYKHVFMSSTRGLYDIYKDVHLKKTALAAETAGNIPQIGVDRILSKVIVLKAFEGNKLGDGTSTLVSATWTLEHENKKTYWMRHSTPGESSNAMRDELYAIDPNWDWATNHNSDNLSDHFTTLATVENNLANEFRKKEEGITFQYTLENTMIPTDQNNNDVITCVTIRAIIRPLGLALNESYYTFKYNDQSLVFRHSQAQAWEAGTYPTGEIYVKLQEAVASSGGTFDFTATEPTGYIPTENGLTFHYKGINIYRINLRHFPAATATDESDMGYYGIVRNNIYQVNVISIYGPGSIDGYISADITINEWYVRNNQDEDLE